VPCLKRSAVRSVRKFNKVRPRKLQPADCEIVCKKWLGRSRSRWKISRCKVKVLAEEINATSLHQQGNDW
jgi:hypothetical protein